MKKAWVLTYSTEDGQIIKKKYSEPRICWGEPDRTLEIVIDEKELEETSVYVPLKTIINLIMKHIEEKK